LLLFLDGYLISKFAVFRAYFIYAIILLRERLGRDVPGILVTADQSREVKERAKIQRIEYFSKPMKPAQLRAYLSHLSAEARSASAPAMGSEG
jgi:hypothetical protein